MSPITIRPAGVDDIPAIARIYAHAVNYGTASFELEPPDLTEMARRYDMLRTGGFPYLAACENGAVLGYAYAGPFRPRPAYRWTLEDSVYVAPEAHRRGIGRRLLQTLIDESERHGFRQMIAVIGDSAQIASIALHRALGFADAGVHRAVGFKFGRWLDTVQMQRALGNGDATPP